MVDCFGFANACAAQKRKSQATACGGEKHDPAVACTERSPEPITENGRAAMRLMT
jgi:hypothetical protein